MGEWLSSNQSWVQGLTEPHPDLSASARRRALALAWLTLVSLPVFTVGAFFTGTLFTLQTIFLLIVLAVGYTLSRTRQASLGSIITIVGIVLAVVSAIPFPTEALLGGATIQQMAETVITFLSFPMFLGVLILRARYSVLVNIGILIAGIVAVTQQPAVTLDSVRIALVLEFVFAVLASMIAILRERDQEAIDIETQKREAVNRRLEERVEERTNDLETSAEIASAANQVRQLEDLIALAVNLIRDRFGFYYVQIFLLDEDEEYAVMADGTGYVGRRLISQGHRLPMNKATIVTSAIKSEQSNLVQDVNQEPNFLRNELLPETQAELAVPLRAQNRVIGALDIQAGKVDAFDDTARRLFETLADQLAVTFENAQLFQESEERAKQLETVAQVSIEASTSLNIDDLLRSVSKLTRDNFGLYHAHIYLLEDDTLELAGGSGEAGLLMMDTGHSIPANHEHSLVARAARSGDYVLVNNVRNEPDYLPNELLPNTRAELALPLLAGEQVIGVMDVQSDSTNAFDQADVQIHSTLAAQVSVAVQNARAFAEAEAAREEARLREERFRTLLENAPEAIFVLSGDTGQFTEVNAVTEEVFGYTEEELTEMTPLDLSPDVQPNGQPSVEFVQQHVGRAMQGEQTMVEWQGITREGDERTFEIRLLRLPGEENLLRVSAIDITEAKEREHIREAQYEVAQRLNAASNAQEVLEAAASFSPDMSMANLYYTSNSGKEQPEKVQSVGAFTKEEGVFATPVGTEFNLSEFAVVEQWMNAPEDVLRHENVFDDPRVDEATQAVYEQIGITAAVVVPLYQGGRWLGIYIFGWKDEKYFEIFDKELLDNIRRQSISVVDAVRSADQLRRRADELTVVAEVGTAAASILDTTKLLKTVADLTKEKFDLYHAHIYLYDDSTGTPLMRLAAGAGDAGDMMVANDHSIRYERVSSLVAEAARNRQTVIVNDVTAEDDFLPNPLLPETKSELAVPLIAGGDLIGVMDVQSELLNRFNQEDARVLETLATQISVAVDNARLFEESQGRASQLQTVAQVATQASSNIDLDEMLRTVSNLTKEKFDLYHAHVYLLDVSGSRLNLAAGAGEAGLKMVQSKHKIAMSKEDSLVASAARNMQTVIANDVTTREDFLPNPLLPDTRAEMSLPMTVGNELVGVLDVQSSQPGRFGDEDAQVLEILATQIAVAVKNARLFKEVSDIRFAIDQHSIVAITKQTGEITYANQKFSDISKFEIDEIIGQDHRIINSGYHSEEFIREMWTTIANGNVWKGEIRNQAKDGTIYWVDTTIVPFLNEQGKPYQYIAIRSDITDQKIAQEATERRARELQAVAAISTRTAGERDVDELLWAVADLTKEEFGRYHAHIYLLADDEKTLRLVAGAGSTGKLMVQEGHTISIDADSLVARAARERRAVRINDVQADAGFMANPNLPKTRSEMATPILYGNQLMGVLDVQDDEVDAFDEVEVQVFTTLTNQIGVAMQNARAFELTQKRLQEVMANNRISEFIRQDLGVQALLENISQVALDTLGATNIVVSQYVPETDSWQGFAGVGEGMTSEIAQTIADPATAYPHGLEALQTQDVVLVVDTRDYPDFPEQYIEEMGLQSVMVIPIIVNSEPYGVMFLNYTKTPRIFNDDEYRLGRSIANQTSLAIERLLAEEETRRQSALVENSEDFIGIATMDGEGVYVNPAGLAMTGYELDEIRGKPLFMFYTDEVAELVENEALPQVMQTGNWRGEVEFQRKDGSTVPVDHNVFLITDDAGNPVNIATVSSDISDRIRREEDLRLRNTAIESATVGVTIADAQAPDMPLIYVNEAFQATTGYSFDEAVGRNCRFLQNDDRDQPQLERLRGAIREGNNVTVTLRNYRKNGELFYNELSISPVRDDAGVVTHFVGISSDVTQRIRSEDRQRSLLKISSLLNDAQSDTAVVSAIVDYAQQQGDLISATLFYIDQKPLDGSGEEELPAELVTSVVWEADGYTGGAEPGMRYDLEMFPSSDEWIDNPYAPIFYENTQTDERLNETTRLMYDSIGSSVLLPMYAQGRWIGLVVLGWHDARAFTESEEQIYADVMRQAPAVLDSLRSTTQLERRASELQTVAQVSATAATQLDATELLQSVADITKERFDLYHAHIYLLSEDGETLNLAAGAGEAGRIMQQHQHSIGLGREHSLVAQAARTRSGVVANDVTLEADFLPNPLLPDTRSELAVPMIVGNDLIGVLDVQSEEVGRFDDEDVLLKETLADQVAVAVRNAQAFERERKTVERLREVDRLKQEFLANMSHELRTPLNSIIGYSEVLLDGVSGELNDEMEEDINAIYSSGKHLLSIINEILDLAKIDAGQMQLSFREIPLDAILSDVVKNNSVLLKDRPVEMHLIADDKIDKVYIDPVRMNQVMLNLVGNAVKFTEEGSINVRYGLQDDETIYIRVEDSGIGMNDEQLAVIFERFRQVDGSSTRRAGGTGLGLTITKQLIEMHGGDIHVESDEGVGTTFWFTLPTLEAALREAEKGNITEEPMPQAGD